VTYPYGVKSSKYLAGHHTGEDHSTNGMIGKPVYAVRDAVVVHQDIGSAYGKVVAVEFRRKVFPGVWRTFRAYYCHLDSINVRPGAHVTFGTLLGRSGNTGNSTGPHLHLEVRKKVKNSNGILFGYGTDVHPYIYKRRYTS
jgi:murein DD-endopeptidase MepM/ murein hydrolase activator NlpD